MLFCAAGPGFLVICNKKINSNERLLTIGNCFSAGIFLFVGIVHLLSDTMEASNEAVGDKVPLGYVFVVLGYSFILFIENVLLGGHDHSDEDSKAINNVSHQGVSENYINMIDSKKESTQADKMSGIMLTVALVIHALLEGIAVGIIKEVDSLIILCVAIIIHKMPAAFSLGIKVAGLQPKLAYGLMGTFVMSSPLGIAIGIGLSSIKYPIIQVIFLGVSAGTFIYIGCTEVLPKQFHDKKDACLKYTSYLLGLIPLSILTCFYQE